MWVFDLGTEGRAVIKVLTGLSWKVQIASHSSHESSLCLCWTHFQTKSRPEVIILQYPDNKPAARYYSYKDSHGAMNTHNKKKTYE